MTTTLPSIWGGGRICSRSSAHIDTEDIHQAFYWDMHCLDLLAVQLKFSVFGGTESPLHLERDVPLVVELSFHFQVPLLNPDG